MSWNRLTGDIWWREDAGNVVLSNKDCQNTTVIQRADLLDVADMLLHVATQQKVKTMTEQYRDAFRDGYCVAREQAYNITSNHEYSTECSSGFNDGGHIQICAQVIGKLIKEMKSPK